MKNILAALFALTFAFMPGVAAKEIQFAFHLDLPSGLPIAYRFLYGMKPVAEKEIRTDVDIPGLPVVSNQRMPYVVYSGSAPNGWEGATLTGYTHGNCSIMDVHVAIRERSDVLPVLYNELFQIGFRRAMIREGVDLCEAKGKERRLRFLYAGREWSGGQLEEAVSEIGTIRALTKLGKTAAIGARFRELSEIQNIDEYRFIQFLVNRAKNDARKYEADLKLAVESFLNSHRKK